MKKYLFVLLGLLSVASAQKFQGLAPTPPMGWNSWNTFAGDINEIVVRGVADTMEKNGMRDAGYTYIVIDDCWALRERDVNGQLVANPEKFPSGMKALADYLHSKGFKFGIYSCAGRQTCAGFPGSWGNEFQDARTFASWGVDYLKYDWCTAETANPVDAYKRIRDGIRAAGRPVVLSICEWGGSKPWEWAADIGHLWRTTGDIYDSYDGQKGWERGWKRILDLQHDLVTNSMGHDGLAKYAGPDHWNDPDMLEVGNAGLSFAESRAHFSFWCVLAAPLMAGNDVRNMSPEILALLTDKEALAVNQDALGKQGFRVVAEPARNIEVWAKELSNKEWAVCALNTSSEEKDITVHWEYFHWFLHGEYSLRDIWNKKAAGTTAKPTTVRLASHDVFFARLTPVAK